MISFPMPFTPVVCKIWLARQGEPDEWDEDTTEYGTDPDIETTCVYAPSTNDDIEDGRPHGATLNITYITFYLPKTLDANLRDALIACYPSNDTLICGRKFEVVGLPVSYMRENTPGDYSWEVKGVARLG